ncbi:hypothetical protein [Phaeobacter gallaeciensis]|uniref:hypothetical protein n=1 Tax=Phaeobacter gallaeciensis TaxID=60890 RepID=UPI0011BDA48C|nr:hypothetical protein [Phaeobacter gallaeciensis]
MIQPVVRAVPDPASASVIWRDAVTVDVRLNTNPPVRLSHPQPRLAIGLLLLGWGVVPGTTCWTQQPNGREAAGQTDEYLTPAAAFRATNGAKAADAILKDARQCLST